MIGVTGFGAYIPWYRLNRFIIFQNMGWFNPVTMAVAGTGEKAVANYDEDSVTMAAAAAINSVEGMDRDLVDGLYLGSTTLPYQERQNAGLVAAALDLPETVQTADITGTMRAGTGAVLAALSAVQSGAAKNAIACAADIRLGKMGSLQEHFFGDGAASLVMGTDGVVAEFLGSYSMNRDFTDHIRDMGQRFDKTWEERWIRDLGYSKIIPEVVKGLLAKLGMEIGDFSKIVFPCYFDREHRSLTKKLGIASQNTMMATVGETGAAHPLLMLTAALEEAKPGDKILVASFGNGSDALAFQVTDAIENARDRKATAYNLARKEELNFYTKYAVFRRIVPVETGIRGETEAFTALSALWRDKQAVFGLVGGKCKSCGLPQFPSQRVCANPECGAFDQMERYRFSGKEGTVFTFTGDMLASSYDPPQIYGMIDLDGGGRIYLDFTDCDLQKLEVGQRAELTFRRKYYDEHRGIHGYFWKAIPHVGEKA